MNNTFVFLLRLMIALVLLLKIGGWFFHYTISTQKLLNVAMFSIIGAYFIVLAINLDNQVSKLTILLCGIYLIGMNFLPQSIWVSLYGILAILLPFIIFKLQSSNVNGRHVD